MAHVPSFPESLETPSAELLALRACDGLDSLRVVQRAYACLEKLIDPQHTSDTEEVHPNRTELSALVGLVNEELQRRIESVYDAMQSLRLTVIGDGMKTPL